MPKFRKRPVVIEAMQVPATCDIGEDMINWGRLAEWLSLSNRSWKATSGSRPGVEITTLEGVMLASPGDWIIRGVANEIYPCKPDIFEATYEPAERAAEGALTV